MREIALNKRQRIERLEMIALNQTLIIDQLTQLVAETITAAVRARALDRSAEALLGLTFGDGVPLDVLALSVQWRQQLGDPGITQTSE